MITNVRFGSQYGLYFNGSWHKWAVGFLPVKVKNGSQYDITLVDGLISGVRFVGVSSPVSIQGGLESHKGVFGGDSRQREILRGQSLKIASDYWLGKPEFDLSKRECRDWVYADALVLFKELSGVDVDFLGWS